MILKTSSVTPSSEQKLPILSDFVARTIDADVTEKLGCEIVLESAATRIADCIEYHLPVVEGKSNDDRSTMPLLFVIGNEGNNGLFAIATARILFLRGWKNITVVTLFALDRPSLYRPKNGKQNKNATTNSGGTQQRIMKQIELLNYFFCMSCKIFPLDLEKIEKHQGIIIDGVLGTAGMDEPPSGISKQAIEAINKNSQQPLPKKEIWTKTRKMPTKVVSIDIPSGLNPVTGETPGVCVKATYTINLHMIKSGQVEPVAREYVGQLWSVEAAMGYITYPHDSEEKLKKFYKESPIKKVF